MELKNKKQLENFHIEDARDYFTMPVCKLEEYAKADEIFAELPKDSTIVIGTDNFGDDVTKKVDWLTAMANDDNIDSTGNLFMLAAWNRAIGVKSDMTDFNTNTDYRIKNISMKVKTGHVLKGPQAVIAVRQSLNLDRDSIIPLPHSHFCIELKSLSPADKVKLNESITEELTDYCSESLGLILSHDSVIYNRAIIDFIGPFIKSHTLNIPDNRDIMDYIDARDLTSILVFLSSALHPKGVDSIITCSNIMKLSEDQKELACGKSYTGLLNPRDTFYVLEDKITEAGKALLRKTKANSITIEELEESKQDASYHMSKELTYGDITFVIEFCDITRMLESGDAFIERLLTLVDDSVMLIDNEKERKEKINRFVELLLVNKYSHFIGSIVLKDGGVINEQADIFNILENLLEELDISIKLINDITDTINDEKISAVAIPKFTCDECKESINKDDTLEEYGDIIEINALEVFTRLRIMA